jgi:hypothetical protein
MAAPKYTDRIRAQELRSASLKIMIEAVRGEGVFGEDFEFRKQLLLRLASNVLPRLNENTGEDGGPMIIQVTSEGANKYGINSSPSNDTK